MLPTIKAIMALSMMGAALTPSTESFSSGGSLDNVLPPFGHTFFCLRYPQECQVTGSNSFQITESRLAELESINRSVNQVIVPKATEDAASDHWRLFPRAGDCNDYAVSKRHLLLREGWPSSRLLLAEVTIRSGEHHLILIVKAAAANLVLDNLKSGVVRTDDVRKDYVWDRVESPNDPRLWKRSL
jgi:predicted transglutaminase-like cysteine proteinase